MLELSWEALAKPDMLAYLETLALVDVVQRIVVATASSRNASKPKADNVVIIAKAKYFASAQL